MSTTIKPELARQRTPETEAGGVLVGFDGSPSSRSAVEYALVEATSGHRSLRIVSILDGHGMPVPRRLDEEEDKLRWRELQEVSRSAEARFPVTEIHQELHVGDPVEQFVDLAQVGDLIVLGKRGLGTFSRMVVGSTSTAVSGRSRVPVIVVPEGWERPQHTGAPIVVGLDVDQDNETLLRFAFAQAQRRNASLVVVHAIDDRPPLVWDLDLEVAARREFVERQVTAVNDMVAEARKEFPLVQVHVAETVQNAPDALLDAASEAQLLVLGRHAKGRFGLPIGSLTRNVLHYAELPVAVVPCS